jgi:hypothetical protein
MRTAMRRFDQRLGDGFGVEVEDCDMDRTVRAGDGIQHHRLRRALPAKAAGGEANHDIGEGRRGAAEQGGDQKGVQGFHGSSPVQTRVLRVAGPCAPSLSATCPTPHKFVSRRFRRRSSARLAAKMAQLATAESAP